MSKEIAKLTPSSLPAFMQTEEALGVENLAQYVIPSRMKIVQRMSGSPFDKLFEPGDAIIMPQLIEVAAYNRGEPELFAFTPVFFFAEWALWNPIQLKGVLPAIRERTTDPSSPMVAKSRTSSLWSIPCPEDNDYSCRYVEHLNYIVVIRNKPEFERMPIILSFSRAEHKSGSNLATRIKMRNAPIFGCNFSASVGVRETQKGTWYGLDISNPDPSLGVTPFVEDEEEFQALKELHLELAKAHEQSILRVDYEDNELSEDHSPEF